jgi:type VI secretion system protein ImpK
MQERQDTGSDAAFTGASSNNQLVAAANPLLNAIPQIRHSVHMTIRWRYASA